MSEVMNTVIETEPITNATPIINPGSGPKTLRTVVREVRNGLWGDGRERIKKLRDAGYDPDEVEELVDSMFGRTKIPFKPYEIRITVNICTVRQGPGLDQFIVKRLLNDRNVYTIVEEADGMIGDAQVGKWGRLQSGLGWIILKDTERVVKKN